MDTHEHTQPVTITVEDAGLLLGISRGLAYDLARRDELRAIRLGRRLAVPTHAIEGIIRDSTRTT